MHGGDFGIVFLRLAGIVRRHRPIRIFGFGRHILRQLRLFQLGLLFGERGRGDGSFGVRPRRQIGSLKMRRHHLQTDLDRRCTEGVVEIVGPQMRNRQRGTAEVKRKRGYACENPQPPRRFFSLSRSDIAIRQPLKVLDFWREGAVLRNAFQRDQLDLRIAAGAQDFQHVHQLAIGHGAIGAQEDKAILARVCHRIERANQIDPFDRVSPIASARSGLMLT